MSFYIPQVGGPKTPYIPQKQQIEQTTGVTFKKEEIYFTKEGAIYYFDKKKGIFAFQPNKNSDSRIMNHHERDDFIKTVKNDSKALISEIENMDKAAEKYNFDNIKYKLKQGDITYTVDENIETHTRTIKPNKGFLSIYETSETYTEVKKDSKVYKWINSAYPPEIYDKIYNQAEKIKNEFIPPIHPPQLPPLMP